jgi:hypothetical protein
VRTKVAPLEVKSPCPKLWQEMQGNRKTRFCDQCELHVHNLSVMSPNKVEQLIARRRNERVCISYGLRPDGNMMTQRDALRYALHRPLQGSADRKNWTSLRSATKNDRSILWRTIPAVDRHGRASEGSVSLVRVVRANNPHFSVNGPASGKFAFIKRERRDTDEAGIIIGMLFQE